MPFDDDSRDVDDPAPRTDPDDHNEPAKTEGQGARDSRTHGLDFGPVNIGGSDEVVPALSPSGADSAQRDRLGRFGRGNREALKHGAYAADAKADTAFLEALRVKREAIARDVGGGAELSTVHGDMVARYTEADALLGGLTDHLIRDGILTKGGRTRASFRAWQATFDRWQKLAAMLGTERRMKLAGAEQLHEAMAAAERARQAQRAERDAK